MKKVKMNKADSLINTVLSNKGELKVLPTKLVGNKTIWGKVIVEACGWANKYDAYKFFKQVEKGEKTIALAYLCYNYSKHIVKYAEKVYNCYGEKLNKKDFLKNIYILENPLFHDMFNAKYNGCVEDCGNFISWNEVFAMGKKFDMVIMNPPYEGEGTPLYMEIAKVVYENCRTEDGKVVSVNPTGMVDSVYDGIEKNSRANISAYGNMMVEKFEYNPEWLSVFGGAKIGNGICITTYSNKGKVNLWDDSIRCIRFGKDKWMKRKGIINKVNLLLGDIDNKGVRKNSIADINGFYSCSSGNKDKINEINSKKNTGFLAFISYNRGNTNEKDGVENRAWDWVTLQSPDYLLLINKAPIMRHYGCFFNTKQEGVNFIKWICSDFVGFIVKHYKSNISNALAMFGNIPCPPPTNGDYSDEVLMKHFNLTKEEMDWIHSEMKNFGWKVNKGMTEAELMKHIEELNK